MLDNEFHISKEAKATLVSIVCPGFEEHKSESDTKRSLAELKELMRTLGVDTVCEVIQNRKSIDPATIIGSGKLDEIAKQAEELDSGLLVFDCELSASQIRNIRKISGMAVVDRCHVILEIFSQHAHTKEAKIQIEIARLGYILPRLSGFWSHLGRQRGGVGVLGGEGEKQIELDRRIIRDRIEFYKRQIEEVSKGREVRKKKRQNQAVTAALVGYTNAGKSSLMNRLCRVNILEEDKLFATLDSTYRMLNPDTKPPMILVDTVGFISNLPNTLIDGFKTTLESALEADLLIIVCDISDPHFEKHLTVTRSVLEELGVGDKDSLIVFTKKDQLTDPHRDKVVKRLHPNSFVISTHDAADVSALRAHIVNYFLSKQDGHDLFIPYDDGAAIGRIQSKTNILATQNHETGIFYRIKTPNFIFDTLGVSEYVLSPEDPYYKEIKKDHL